MARAKAANDYDVRETGDTLQLTVKSGRLFLNTFGIMVFSCAGVIAFCSIIGIYEGMGRDAIVALVLSAALLYPSFRLMTHKWTTTLSLSKSSLKVGDTEYATGNIDGVGCANRMLDTIDAIFFFLPTGLYQGIRYPAEAYGSAIYINYDARKISIVKGLSEDSSEAIRARMIEDFGKFGMSFKN